LVTDPPALDDGLIGPDVRALVTRGLGQITADVIAALPGLEVVARCGAGLDNVDTSAAADAGVAVVHAPGVTGPAVAEHALALMLALARRLCELDRAVGAGDWAIRNGFEAVELRGKRLGIVGLGATGLRLAELGAALGMDVVGAARRDIAAPVERVPLADLLATSDVVQICVPLTPETTAMIGGDELAAMKPGVLLVNTSRGPIVDHAAVGEALLSGSLGGYAADVWDPEPPGADDPLPAHPRTIVTPHIAALTDVTYREICVRTAEAVRAVLVGADPDPATVFVSRRRS
ncbi:MAG: NAD(P)-dependent oxidoreductase, partial [Ilumatobacteraceae bacterium]